MSANFTQISGPGGRVQTLVPGASAQTFLWNPQSLKGQLDGGDYIYASRGKVKTTGTLTTTVGTTMNGPPNWEILASALGQVRTYSQFLGEMLPKSLNSVALLANHDMFFVNGFRPITRKRGQSVVGATGATVNCEYVFEIPFERDYLTRSTDSCPWLPFLEGGIIEVDLQASTALANWGWSMTGNWQQTLTVDWYTDKQALIPSPVQSRLYRVTTTGPEYVLKSVGSPQGLDGVMPGARLAIMSWLMGGKTSGASASFPDNGFYAAFGTGGLTGLGTNGLTRMDVPFRSQVSIDDVSAWFESFLADAGPLRQVENINTGNALNGHQNDLAGWPNVMNPILTEGSANQSLISDNADFFPMIWPSHYDKISDMQKVNGDLSFTATLTTPPGSSILNLFRTDEVCSYTQAKVMDMMQRMGLPHRQQGGAYDVVPKYAGGKKADPTTIWGFPLKIVRAG
jgi:hypothetical protein